MAQYVDILYISTIDIIIFDINDQYTHVRMTADTIKQYNSICNEVAKIRL